MQALEREAAGSDPLYNWPKDRFSLHLIVVGTISVRAGVLVFLFKYGPQGRLSTSSVFFTKWAN